jgi:hypothetical protein
MSLDSLPSEFESLSDAVVRAIRRTYEVNAERYDESIGDDPMVFGFVVYRNSWFAIEEEVLNLDAWNSARPNGSLVIVGAGLRIHVYRCGDSADVDLDSFRLDDPQASLTQRQIAASNAEQLRLDLDDLDDYLKASKPLPATGADGLRELVIVHAGNPDDACCGIWAGAPVATDEIVLSPWAWIDRLWQPGGSESGIASDTFDEPKSPRHDELPEPPIVLRPVAEADEQGMDGGS